MLLEELIRDTPCTLRSGDAKGVRITDVVEDSRTAVPGSLFIARRGTFLDGAAFVEDAIRRGAEAVLVGPGTALERVPPSIPVVETDRPATVGAMLAERFFGNPSSDLFVVGVTGTNGKTTVTSLAQTMLNAAGVKTGLVGTVTIDDGRDVGAATLTTPPASELSRSFATMREHACRAVMLECSSHALDQGRCDGLSFDLAVFLNLSGDHLDYHADLDDYARAKAHLFEVVGAGGAIVNADDPYAARMIDAYHGSDILRFAPARSTTNADAHVHIHDASLTSQRLELHGPWGFCSGTLHAPGAHNATNALVSACIAHRAGLDADEIGAALDNARMPPGRLQRIASGAKDEPCVFIDFAHTDDALATTLRSVRQSMTEGARLIVLFGCGGNRDASKRPRMGHAACAHADAVVLTSDNPRTESPSRIIEDVLEGITPEDRTRVEVHADRAIAIGVAIALAGPHDVVVIAGKGHEREQLIPDGAGGIERRPFDDAAHALEALRRRSMRVGS